jgi:phosphomannomutase
LYSASIGYFDELLKRNDINFESIHMKHDINFGGGMPEPKTKYLQELIEIITDRTNAIGLSNDGDGDRFGVINEKGEYVTPNEIIALLLGHLIKNKNYNGKLIKTVGASQLLDIIADKYDVDVVETPVGFKWVGAAMRKYETIIGGEESGGLSIKGHIPEKDGIIADLLVLEMIAYENRPLWELQEELHHLAGCTFINERIDVKLQDQQQLNILMDKYLKLDEIASFNIEDIDKKDGVKYYLDDEKTWVLIRPSGTEPLLRIYFESDSKEKIKELKAFFS